MLNQLISNVSMSDRISVPTERSMTDSGQMIVPCAFARTGEQVYSARSLGIKDGDLDRTIKVLRDEADVFSPASIDTFRSVPVTIGHPMKDGKSISVTAENAKELQVGMLEGLPTRDDELLTGTLVISNQEAIDAINEGTQELSAGYKCDLEVIVEDGIETIYQRNIKANHIAIVLKGRAGSSCRIADEEEEDMDPVKEIATVSVTDTAETQTVLANLNDALEVADASELLGATLKIKKELAVANQALVDFAEDFTSAVVSRVDVLSKAKSIADMSEFESGATNADIMRKVVVSQQAELKDKDDTYIAVVFDLMGDSANVETPMGKLLRSSKVLTADKAEPYTNPVDAARKSMVAKQNAQFGTK